MSQTLIDAPDTEPAIGQIVHLENGERTDQKTFHGWYKTTSEEFKAELIGGEVVVASPVKLSHGEHHAQVMAWLWMYAIETPGTSVRDNATAIMGNDSEPQPDGALAIKPEWGGQTGIDLEGYVTGAPELIVEVANSSGAIDMHRKKRDYEKAGVREYIVVLLRDRQVRWFVRHGETYNDLAPDAEGVLRSTQFPGLWLDRAALLNLDGPALLATLRHGLDAPEHAAFVKELAARKK